MYVKKLIMNNYRGFKSCEIPFNESINIIYGVNGSGKSTVLNALASIFFVLANKEAVPSKKNIIPSHYFNDPDRECSIGIEVEIGGKVKKLSLHKPKPTDATDNDQAQDFTRLASATSVNLFHKKAKLADGTFIDGDIDYFKTASGACATLVPGTVTPLVKGAKQSGSELRLELSHDAPFAVMKGIQNFENLRAEFEELEAIEQQKRLETDDSIRDTKLEQIRNSIKMLDAKYGAIKIDRTIKGKPLVVEKDGRFFKLTSQLSAGEAGIIWRCQAFCVNEYFIKMPASYFRIKWRSNSGPISSL